MKLTGSLIIIGLIVGLLLDSCLRFHNTDVAGLADNQGKSFTANEYSLEDERKIDTASLSINLVPNGDYSLLKEQILSDRNEFNVAYSESNNPLEKEQIHDSARSYVQETLINKIIPFWYGTQWDFNGYSDDPYKGKISCAYFVSTTLRDIGFNLNRYKFAQQKPKWEVTTLVFGNDFDLIDNPDLSPASGSEQLAQSGINEGLYFVGLDNHVGYLLVLDGDIYFINSSHIRQEVVFEKARFSYAFKSKQYGIAEITANDSLISCWINSYPIDIIDFESNRKDK